MMLLNINYGFFLERDYIADSFFEASQMNALLHESGLEKGMKEMLKRMGITHILYSTRDWGIEYPSYLQEFLKDHAAPVCVTQDEQLTLYRILFRSF
ncbi:MAG: hypothetical protein AB1756_08170 [Acidobacteriota bacterium]